MSLKKYTLVIDGNHFLHKTFHVSGKIKKDGALDFKSDPKGDANILYWKLATDISFEIRKFLPILDRVVYCIDSSTWRKDFFPDAKYKANRETDNTVDWGKIYEAHDVFAKGLQQLGIIISRVHGTEGDDLIFGWSSLLNQNGSNCLIMSGDNDLIQLVAYDKTNDTNTLYFNKYHNRLYTFPSFDRWINNDKEEVLDFFSQPIQMESLDKSNLKQILNKNAIEKEGINSQEFLFKKVLVGDSGDNVSPLHTWDKEIKTGKNKGNIRTYSITDNMANKVLNSFKNHNGYLKQAHFFEDVYIKEICKLTKKVVNIENKSIDELVQKWKLNRDLVYLHNRCIPEPITKAMYSSIEDSIDFRLNESDIKYISDRENVLEVLPYEKDLQEKQSNSSFFKSFGI